MKRSVHNYTWADLHPDDGDARVELRRFLRTAAGRQGYTEATLSIAAGRRPGWAKSVWATSSWRLATIQHLSSVLGYQMGFHAAGRYGEGMELEPIRFQVLRKAYAKGSADAHTVQRMWLADYGRRLREARDVSPHVLAARLSMTPARLLDWEECDKDDYMLLTAQRYFRALGNPLRLMLSHEDGSATHIRTPYDPTLATDGSAGAVNIREKADGTYVWHRDDPEHVIRFTPGEWRQWLDSR